MDVEDKFAFEAVEEGGKRVIKLKGIIDEDTTFEEIKSIEGDLVFNWKEITSINSCGIRNWVNFLKDLGTKEVFYSECPPLIVRQMNMVPSFVGDAHVLSVYLPYVCDACEHEDASLVDENCFNGDDIKVDEVIKCTSCGEEAMEFDGHPVQYFAFTK